jgi:tight adherence protein B
MSGVVGAVIAIDGVVVGLSAGVVVGLTTVTVLLLRVAATMKDKHVAPVRTQATRGARGNSKLDHAVASSPVLQRALAVTANLAERRGMVGSVERNLRAADLPVRPVELILARAAIAVVLPFLVFGATQSVIKTALVILLAIALPPMILKFLVKRRRKRFVAQLPDALTNLAGSLRAGRSVGQAMDSLSRQTEDPMGRELRKVVAELRLGRSLPDALADASDRVGSDDFRWAVLAMQIQAEVGGNLAELLEQVATTMRSRARLRGEVKALTAEGRASAMMLVIMVPALGAVMYAVNSQYMMPMFTTSIGKIMLAVSAVMIGAGYLWMNKVIKIDA